LKPNNRIDVVELQESPPMRGRGLKLIRNGTPGIAYPSPPMRGRGLKQMKSKIASSCLGRPPCGGVD